MSMIEYLQNDEGFWRGMNAISHIGDSYVEARQRQQELELRRQQMAMGAANSTRDEEYRNAQLALERERMQAQQAQQAREDKYRQYDLAMRGAEHGFVPPPDTTTINPVNRGYGMPNQQFDATKPWDHTTDKPLAEGSYNDPYMRSIADMGRNVQMRQSREESRKLAADKEAAELSRARASKAEADMRRQPLVNRAQRLEQELRLIKEPRPLDPIFANQPQFVNAYKQQLAEYQARTAPILRELDEIRNALGAIGDDAPTGQSRPYGAPSSMSGGAGIETIPYDPSMDKP
jgi:hypothetical protein